MGDTLQAALSGRRPPYQFGPQHMFDAARDFVKLTCLFKLEGRERGKKKDIQKGTQQLG